MRKGIALLVMILILPLVSASTYTGWLGIGEEISYGDYAIIPKDGNFDGEALLMVSTPSRTSYISLRPGDEKDVGNVKVKLVKMFLGKKPMFYLNVTLPPLLVNQSIVVGGYKVLVKDVKVDSYEVVVSNGTGGKSYTKPFQLNGYSFSITPRPKVFSGELKLLSNVTYGDYKLTLAGLNMTIVNNKSKSILNIEFEGKDYYIDEGDYGYVGPFIVKYNGFRCEMQGNLCDPIISLEVYLRALDISISYDPSKDFWVYEGKAFRVGDLVVKVKGIADGAAYIGIENNCGNELHSGVLRASQDVIGALEYDGLRLGLLETSQDNNGKKAHFIAFYTERKKPQYLAYLNVTVSAPREVTMLTPFTVNVSVKNEGTSEVLGMIAKFEPGNGFKVLRDEVYIKSLAPGKSEVLKFTLVPLKPGNLTVGRLVVEGPVPYPLACGGLSLISFTSNSPIVNVKAINVTVGVSYLNVTRIGEPFEVNFVVDPPIGNITMALPSGVGLLSEGSLHSGVVTVPASVKSIKLVVVSPGNYTIPLYLEAYGVKLYSSKISFEAVGSSQAVTVTKTKTETKTITLTNGTARTLTVTETKTEVKTETQVKTLTKHSTTTVTKTIEVKSGKSNLLVFLFGVILGAGVIILLAWIKARS
ncbi:CARDB domain-containing protein [Pyrococcus abyssi]|uniref:CARDB domain-containing protein n=1 Tax=Pyrococcus abyssi (strain GE5 / Orsay) TaxID=272844 RepID=Q9UYM2_PYRAB|nr:CARDB domain-containing protein [Pyrococcus abyssi]CAB50390.1 Hypothetical protein PAB1388 [Pyrococcus abyssi GE5]CCE70937.1 TPA: hypothetical protein PAB1388 [Pyrococcus abyssi GE5]